MGSMYRMKGEPARAVECYDQALKDHPGHRNAIFNKGVTMMLDLEQPEQAVEFWQSVLREYPGLTLSSGAELSRIMPEIVVDAALQLEAHGRKVVALRAYEQALKLDPSFAPALVHGAWLMEGMGRAADAQPLWKRVLERYPDATDPAGQACSRPHHEVIIRDCHVSVFVFSYPRRGGVGGVVDDSLTPFPLLAETEQEGAVIADPAPAVVVPEPVTIRAEPQPLSPPPAEKRSSAVRIGVRSSLSMLLDKSGTLDQSAAAARLNEFSPYAVSVLSRETGALWLHLEYLRT